MTKKEVCQSHDTFAMFVGSWIQLKHIEYGVDDYLYWINHYRNRWQYHKSKIFYDENGDAYFIPGFHRWYLKDATRVEDLVKLKNEDDW